MYSRALFVRLNLILSVKVVKKFKSAKFVQSLGLAVAAVKVAGKTRFMTTRFGNVLWPNGSVIPRLKKQIANGGPVTATHPEIARFFMTIPEACRLVLEAATISAGNDIFDIDESVKIVHLAEQMIALSGFSWVRI